ncbi:MAG TPA: hypothetical protein VGM28_03210 [Candidatus Limnocylindrales bacterium]
MRRSEGRLVSDVVAQAFALDGDAAADDPDAPESELDAPVGEGEGVVVTPVDEGGLLAVP